MDNRRQSYILDVDVLPVSVTHIIGRGGRIINKIRQDTRTRIYIPTFNGICEPKAIRIIGNEEDCKLAQAKILSIENQTIEKIWENIVVDTVKIDPPYQRHFLDRKAEIVRQISNDFGRLRVHFPELKSNSSDVKIIGPREIIEAAKNRISIILEEYKKQVRIVVIEQKHHHFLLGEPSKSVNQIKQQYKVDIKFPDAPKEPLPEIITNSEGIKYCDMIWIYGASINLDAAESALLKLIPVTLEIDIPHEYHKCIIGRECKRLNSLMKFHNVFIHFPRQSEPLSDTVIIQGTSENAENAKENLLHFKSEGHKEFTNNIVSDTMNIEPEYQRCFLLHDAEILKQISQDLGGVSITFPRKYTNASEVIFNGKVEIVQAAKYRISVLLEKYKKSVEVVVIDQKDHSFIIGWRGSNINIIERNYNVKLKFPEYKQCKVTEDRNKDGIKYCDMVCIYGAPDDIQSAKAALLKLIPVKIEMNIPKQYHRYLIGRKGEVIKNIKATYNVNIQVSMRNDTSTIITIQGYSHSSVEEAKVALLQRQRQADWIAWERELKSFTMKIQVPKKYHRKLIGRDGEIVSDMCSKNNVRIQFPKGSNEDETTVTVSGMKINVEETVEQLMSMVNKSELPEATVVSSQYSIEN